MRAIKRNKVDDAWRGSGVEEVDLWSPRHKMGAKASKQSTSTNSVLNDLELAVWELIQASLCAQEHWGPLDTPEEGSTA